MKKFLSILFCALTITASAQTYSRYDVNRDGNISAEDLTLVVNAILGRINYPVTGITLSSEDASLFIGESLSLTPSFEPEEPDLTLLLWTSSDESVATVVNGEVSALATGQTTITATTTDGSNLSASCEITVTDPSDDYEFVDMGLPSGTLWAACNVGANAPEETGDYFAWGEVNPQIPKTFTWKTYKWMQEGMSSTEFINKYQVEDGKTNVIWYSGTTFVGDGKNVLDPEDDAATVNLGSIWQMPTKAQYEELLNEDNCTVENDAVVGMIKGTKVTSKTTRATLFFPAAGYYNNDTSYGNCYYWTREHNNINYSPATDKALSIHVGNYSALLYSRDRCYGMPIRAVRKKTY